MRNYIATTDDLSKLEKGLWKLVNNGPITPTEADYTVEGMDWTGRQYFKDIEYDPEIFGLLDDYTEWLIVYEWSGSYPYVVNVGPAGDDQHDTSEIIELKKEDEENIEFAMVHFYPSSSYKESIVKVEKQVKDYKLINSYFKRIYKGQYGSGLRFRGGKDDKFYVYVRTNTEV